MCASDKRFEKLKLKTPRSAFRTLLIILNKCRARENAHFDVSRGQNESQNTPKTRGQKIRKPQDCNMKAWLWVHCSEPWHTLGRSEGLGLAQQHARPGIKEAERLGCWKFSSSTH